MNRKIVLKTRHALLLAVLLASAAAAPAQSGFRVSTAETGLELGSGSSSSKPRAEKKAKAASTSPEQAAKQATEITCTGETSFDAKAGMAVFVKEVRVKDPQFTLSAEKLTAYLKKPDKETAGEAAQSGTSAATPAPTPKPEAKADGKADAKSDSPASGLERAIAEGHVLITQDRLDEKTGETTHYTGKGAKAEYNALSGEMTLSGWPQIQQGLNAQVATEEGTVMVMDRDGHLHTKGPSMTVIKAETKPAKTP